MAPSSVAFTSRGATFFPFGGGVARYVFDVTGEVASRQNLRRGYGGVHVRSQLHLAMCFVMASRGATFFPRTAFDVAGSIASTVRNRTYMASAMNALIFRYHAYHAMRKLSVAFTVTRSNVKIENVMRESP